MQTTNDFKNMALFSDTTEEFVSPAEPKMNDTVTIRFRSAKDAIKCVSLRSKDTRYLMTKEKSVGCFDYYAVQVALGTEKFTYCFEMEAGGIRGYYDMRGSLCPERDAHYEFILIPGFETPDWAKGAVMYQIYVDRFCNGDPSNDVLSGEYQYAGRRVAQVTDWNRYPENMDVANFYGGDLQGVLDKMDYLQELGVEVIYFNPLFVSPSNHKYDIQDYDYIDPHFGRIVDDAGDLLPEGSDENRLATRYVDRVTNKANLEASNELFAEVVAEAHKRGMKVILDGVFNHCGSFNKWMDRERIYENAEGYEKGAYVSADSPYRSFFKFGEKGEWPYNSDYESWWDYETLPKLNYEDSKKLFDYVMRIGAKWVSPPYNADGWRLDVAADLGFTPEFNHYFWKEFRKAVKKANPQAIILAEHYGDTRPWLGGDEWDSVMNYDAFMEPMTWFLTGMEKHSDEYQPELVGDADSFWEAMRKNGANFAMPSRLVAMNQLSNHDHSRFMTRTSHKAGRIDTLGAKAADEGNNPAVFREAVVMLMTWPGAPTLYYGDEAGVCGFTDPDNRRTYPWGHEDQELVAFHKEIIRIHKSCEELRTGSLMELKSDENFLAYARFRASMCSVVLMNCGNHEMTQTIPVWQAGVPREEHDALEKESSVQKGGAAVSMTRLMYTDESGYQTDPVQIAVTDGNITVTLPKFSAMILRYAD